MGLFNGLDWDFELALVHSRLLMILRRPLCFVLAMFLTNSGSCFCNNSKHVSTVFRRQTCDREWSKHFLYTFWLVEIFQNIAANLIIWALLSQLSYPSEWGIAFLSIGNRIFFTQFETNQFSKSNIQMALRIRLGINPYASDFPLISGLGIPL